MMSRLDELLKRQIEIKSEQAELIEELGMIKGEVLTLQEEFEVKVDKKDREFKEYRDSSGNKITIKEQSRTTLDRKKAQQKMTPEDYDSCLNVSTFMVVDFKTVERQEQLKKMFKEKKKE